MILSSYNLFSFTHLTNPYSHRELAIQIAEQFGVLGAAMGVRVALVIGGMNMMKQGAELARRPHIVIATPGQTHITLYSIRRRRPFQYDQISQLTVVTLALVQYLSLSIM